MKRILLLFILIPILSFSHEYSFRILPIYLMPTADVVILGSCLAIEKSISENQSVEINLNPTIIVGDESEAFNFNSSVGYKLFSEKKFFISSRMRLSAVFSGVDYWEQTHEEWSEEFNNYIITDGWRKETFLTIGPEFVIGKRFYYTKQQKGFFDLGFGVSYNKTIYSEIINTRIVSYPNGQTDITKEYSHEDFLYFWPNFTFQFGYTFRQKR